MKELGWILSVSQSKGNKWESRSTESRWL